MAAGDNVLAHSSIANNASLTIRPGASVEWQIFNLYMGGDWELYRTDGTHAVLIDSGSEPGSIQKRSMIASNTIYFTVKNVSGGSAYFGYDALVVK